MARTRQTHRTKLEIAEGTPHEAAAGTEIPLRVKVFCPSGCDLRGATVHVTAPDGSLMTAELTTCYTGINETTDAVARVPISVGHHVWTILFPRHETEELVHDECSTVLSVICVPHVTSAAVWDVPSPVAVNTVFTVKVGIQCSAACCLAGRGVEILDEVGGMIGSGMLADARLPGTDGLYSAEVTLTAPGGEGVYCRTATLRLNAPEVPHEHATASFSFRAVGAPDHAVSVVVVDANTGARIDDVEVRFGPYMTTTGRSGETKLQVPTGPYELTIRRDGYTAVPLRFDVSADIAITVQAMPAPTKAEHDARLATFEDYPWG